jgi:hypothetical protein
VSKLERLQRGLAALVGLGGSLRMLYGTFRDPDPRAHFPGIILLRIAICGYFLLMFARRARGRKLDAIGWAVFSLFLMEGIWRGANIQASVASALCVGLAIVGSALERRLESAAQQGVAADGAAPRR